MFECTIDKTASTSTKTSRRRKQITKGISEEALLGSKDFVDFIQKQSPGLSDIDLYAVLATSLMCSMEDKDLDKIESTNPASKKQSQRGMKR